MPRPHNRRPYGHERAVSPESQSASRARLSPAARAFNQEARDRQTSARIAETKRGSIAALAACDRFSRCISLEQMTFTQSLGRAIDNRVDAQDAIESSNRAEQIHRPRIAFEPSTQEVSHAQSTHHARPD